MGDSQIVEAEAGLGPNQDPVDGTLRDDLERPVLPEKSESSSTPPISNLASVDVRALKKPKNIHRLMHTQRSPGTVRMTLPIPKIGHTGANGQSPSSYPPTLSSRQSRLLL